MLDIQLRREEKLATVNTMHKGSVKKQTWLKCTMKRATGAEWTTKKSETARTKSFYVLKALMKQRDGSGASIGRLKVFDKAFSQLLIKHLAWSSERSLTTSPLRYSSRVGRRTHKIQRLQGLNRIIVK